jgi:hypothetical protein
MWLCRMKFSGKKQGIMFAGRYKDYVGHIWTIYNVVYKDSAYSNIFWPK